MPLDPSKIKSRRAQLGLTQAAAAAIVQMPRSNWARLETTRTDPALSTAEDVARALGCGLEKLLITRSNTPPSTPP